MSGFFYFPNPPKISITTDNLLMCNLAKKLKNLFIKLKANALCSTPSCSSSGAIQLPILFSIIKNHIIYLTKTLKDFTNSGKSATKNK